MATDRELVILGQVTRALKKLQGYQARRVIEFCRDRLFDEKIRDGAHLPPGFPIPGGFAELNPGEDIKEPLLGLEPTPAARVVLEKKK